MTANKRTMQTVQREADKRARKIQLNFTQFCITNKSNQPKKEKGKVKGIMTVPKALDLIKNSLNHVRIS